jgi:hypothetical protein
MAVQILPLSLGERKWQKYEFQRFLSPMLEIKTGKNMDFSGCGMITQWLDT